jgi:micrococcal nuclease
VKGDSAVATSAPAAATGAAPQDGQPCVIKGNISSGGKKIYHVPGGASYKVVKPEQCFNTEAEAAAAGYVKASR